MNPTTKISRIWLILLLFPVVVSAQDWQNICSPGVTFYQNLSGSIQAFRLDSVDITQYPDSVFYSYRAIRDPIGGCYDTTYGSIFGLEVTKKPLGVFHFLNRTNSVLTLHTLEGMGFSWVFFSFSSGDYIEATISIMTKDTILGIPDSLKVILFQAKDFLGNNITHPINQQHIILSKQLGLTRIFDLYTFPNDTTSYSLLGKSTPSVGMQNLTWNEIWDFNVGDVFHYVIYEVVAGVSVYSQLIHKILSKEVIPDSNKVIYTIERCQKKSASAPPPNVIYTHDTTTATYTFQSDTSFIAALPREFFNQGDNAPIYSRLFPSYNGRQTHGEMMGVFFTPNPPCWNPPFEFSSEQRHTEGLGQTKYSWYENWENYVLNLVYFKKGTETWGTPVSTDCTTLVPTEDVTAPETEISIYPVPASTHITIEVPAKSILSIMNLNGQELLTQTITEPKTMVDISTLPNGVYIVRVTGDKAVGVGKFIKQ